MPPPVPVVPNNGDGPQAREPSKCLYGQSHKDRPKRPSDRQLQEAQKRTLIGPQLLRRRRSESRTGGAAGVPAAKQPRRLHAQRSGAELPQAEKVVFPLRSCLTLCDPVACVLPGFSVRERVPRQEHWSVLAYTGCHALLEHCISYHPRHQAPGAPGAARTPATQAAAPPPRLPSRGKPKPSRAASGANPRGRPTCRGGNKTTSETLS